MNLRPQRQDAPEINLAPLIDVVFLLLIFFMVSTTFKDDARLAIRLPEVDAQASSAEEPDWLRITIDQDGRYDVADRTLPDRTAASLKRALIAALADYEEGPPLLIRADARTPHQAVMTAMDVASQIGLQQIVFAAASDPPSAEPDAAP